MENAPADNRRCVSYEFAYFFYYAGGRTSPIHRLLQRAGGAITTTSAIMIFQAGHQLRNNNSHKSGTEALPPIISFQYALGVAQQRQFLRTCKVRPRGCAQKFYFAAQQHRRSDHAAQPCHQEETHSEELIHASGAYSGDHQVEDLSDRPPAARPPPGSANGRHWHHERVCRLDQWW